MATNLLWAHLLRKDATTTTDPPSQIPPIAPQDRTGTSMRMLIHDTQVNLEKFSARLDGLLQRVDDCRAQVVNANKLLDVERDKLLTEILEIVHRCQSEMKTHIGSPAQASVLDLVHVSQVSTDKSVQALEKRIDALQALLQTHAHTMQSIQDQQNTLIGAVLPLVPVLHGIPSQMDQIKMGLSDMVENAVSALTNNVESVRSTLAAELAHGRGCTMSLTRAGFSSKSSRRRRSDASVLGPREIDIAVSSPLDSRGRGGPHLSLKRFRTDGVTHHASDAQLSRKLSRLTAPLTNSGDPPPVPQTPQTPRQPLVDLLLVPSSNTSRARHHMKLTSGGCMRPCETLRTAGGPSTNMTSVSGRLLHPHEHARPESRGPTKTQRRSRGLHDIGSPITPGLDATSKESKTEEILEPKFAGVVSIHSSPPSAPPSSGPLEPRRDPSNVSCTQRGSRQQDNIPDGVQIELVPVPPSLPGPLSSYADPSPPKSMSLRDRRAQMSTFGRTETRRFIPLMPWSDEEE